MENLRLKRVGLKSVKRLPTGADDLVLSLFTNKASAEVLNRQRIDTFAKQNKAAAAFILSFDNILYFKVLITYTSKFFKVLAIGISLGTARSL